MIGYLMIQNMLNFTTCVQMSKPFLHETNASELPETLDEIFPCYC